MTTNAYNTNAYITIDYNKLSDEKQKEFMDNDTKPDSEKNINLLDKNTLALKEANKISITWTKPDTDIGSSNLNPAEITIDKTVHQLKTHSDSNDILTPYQLQITQKKKGGGNSKRYYGTPLKKTRYAKRKSANRRKRAKTARLFRE